METVTRTVSGVGAGGCASATLALARNPARKTAGIARANMGQISERKKGRKRTLIFIDRWYGRWLEVGGSGLEWNDYPPAHGRRFTAPKILRRRVPSFHRREEPHHHPFPLAQARRRGVHHSSRAASSISRHHVGGGVRPDERPG